MPGPILGFKDTAIRNNVIDLMKLIGEQSRNKNISDTLDKW